MLKIIRKADIILFFVLLALGVLLSLAGFSQRAGSAFDPSSATVQIRVGGQVYDEYPLSENREVIVDQDGKSQNKVIIKDGQVQIIEASCHNQICVKQGAISMPGQTIICLPNKVVVEILSNSEGGDIDVVSG